MELHFFRVVCSLTMSLLFACGGTDSSAPVSGTYLYLGAEASGSLPRYGDVVMPTQEGGSRVVGLLSGRDTMVTDPVAEPVEDTQSWMALDGSRGEELTEDYLVAKPFTYRMDSVTYWASFEPSFTGFPEFARAGAKDFVNRMAEWDGVAPGLEYTEYALRRLGGQSVLLVSERLRGRYINTFAVLIDSLEENGFAGRLIRQGKLVTAGEVATIRFDRATGLFTTYTANEFVEVVNSGFSRSYLLFPPANIADSELARAGNRLPRRALIDSDDPGRISASFLPDGRFMLLTDDQVALEGDYTLDLDKGILTVDDGKTTTFRIFLTTTPKISFTLPVSVLSLSGTKMVGTDNYLRIEVVQP